MAFYLEELVEFLPEIEEELPAPSIVYRSEGKRLTEEQAGKLSGLLAMVWKDGKRHALALAVSGMMVKEGYEEGSASALVHAVCSKAGDRETGDRLRAVQDSYRSATLGQPVRAWREIEGELGQDSLRYLRSVLTKPAPLPDEGDDDPYEMPFRLTERQPFPSYPMLIEGLLPSDPRGKVCYLCGLSQSFKSFLALDWACHISAGLNWQGHETAQSQVLYIACEGGYEENVSRLRAWESEYGVKADNLFCRLSPIQILNDESVSKVIEKYQAKCPDLKPRLVILDTLSQCAGSADENSAKDARTIYANSKLFGKAWGATVLIVHHSGKAEGAIMRGASAFFDDSDAVVQMVRPSWQTGGMNCTLNVKKIKGGRMTLGHEMNAREVEWEADGRRGKDLVLVPQVLRSVFEATPKF